LQRLRLDVHVAVEVMERWAELSLRQHFSLPNLRPSCLAATLNQIGNMTHHGQTALAAQGVMVEHRDVWVSWRSRRDDLRVKLRAGERKEQCRSEEECYC
jgi:hypothetical protein